MGQFLLKSFTVYLLLHPLPASALSVCLLLSPLVRSSLSPFPVFRYCVSVFNSDSLFPSLIQSPSPSFTLFLPPFPFLFPLCHSHSRPDSQELYWHTGSIVLPSHDSSKFNEGAILKMCFQSVSLTLPLLLFYERVFFLFFLSFDSSLSNFLKRIISLSSCFILNAYALFFF